VLQTNGGTTALTATGANVTIAGTLTASGGLTGVLPVANGGTGASTLTGYVKGSGTSPFTASASVPVGDLSGTLPVASGGTGTTTLTANNVLIGNGTSAVQVVSPGTTGNILTSNGTTWVSQAAVTGAESFVLFVNGGNTLPGNPQSALGII